MELFDVLIFGAVFYYIVQAVRRAASTQKDKRPPGSIATEDGEQLSWAERTERALEGAMEWEEKQQRLEQEAEIRAEIEAVRAAERGEASPWSQRRSERRRALESAAREVPADAAAPSLSDALAGVAAMLDERASLGQRPQPDDPFQAPALRRSSPPLVVRPSRPTAGSRPEPTSVARRSAAELTTTGIEVEAERPDDPAVVVVRTTHRPLTDVPGLGRLTPLQRAIVYGEIFGKPVALGGSSIDDSLD